MQLAKSMKQNAIKKKNNLQKSNKQNTPRTGFP